MTKLCVVFDVAAKHDRKRVNDTMWPGPKLQRELVDVLTRFRWAPVALSADICKLNCKTKTNHFTDSCGVISTRQESLICMNFNVYCLETLLRHFVHSISFRTMPRQMLWNSLKQQGLLTSQCTRLL